MADHSPASKRSEPAYTHGCADCQWTGDAAAAERHKVGAWGMSRDHHTGTHEALFEERVERAAEALFRAKHDDTWNDYADIVKDTFRKTARIVLEADRGE